MQQVPMIPVYVEGVNDDLFVSKDVIAPTKFTIGNVTQTTSALGNHKQLNIIGISTNQALLDSGNADYTDSLDTYLRLQTLVIKRNDVSTTAFGKWLFKTVTYIKQLFGVEVVQVVDVSNNVNGGFCKTEEGNNRDLVLNYTRTIKNHGTSIYVSVTGTANVQTGNVWVNAVTTDPRFTVIGYTLEAYRTNYNRQPA